jgi:hypothetical protein
LAVDYEKNTNVSNTGQSGYSIINLKKRLDLTYPAKYQLIIEPGDLLFRVKLTINIIAD